MNDRIAQIAAKLTIDQQDALLSLTLEPQMKTIPWCVKHGYSLEKMGLAARTLMSDKSYLTALGHEVQTFLLKERSNEL